MAIAEAHDDHSAYAPRHHRAERAAVGALRPRGIVGHARGRRGARARRERRVAARGWTGVPRPARARVDGSLRRGRSAARSSAATSPTARSTRWSSASRSPRSRSSRSRAASTTRPSSTRTARCSSSGSRATTGRRDCSSRRSRARTSPAASTTRRTRRSPPGPRPPTRSSRRASTSSPAGSPRASGTLAVLGAPLPGLPLHPMVGGDAWAVLAVELAQREGATGDLRAAHDLLEEIEAARRGVDRRHRVAGRPSPRRGQGPPRRRGRRHRHPRTRRSALAEEPRRGPRARPRPHRAGGHPPAPRRTAAPRSRCSTSRSRPSASSTSSPTPHAPRN